MRGAHALSALMVAIAMAAAPAMSVSAPAVRVDTDQRRVADLVTASHILAQEGLIDGVGHLSVRSKSNPTHYFMTRVMAPSAVTARDVIEFDQDSRPLMAAGRAVYGERFIHGEIYRARPDVQSVAHSHAAAILPFALTDAPFVAAFLMASFVGPEPAPKFEIRDALGEDNRMLVSTASTGAALAKTLGARNVVLLRGHGMVVTAGDESGGPVRWATQRAYYAVANADALVSAAAVGKAKPLNAFESRFAPGELDSWWDEHARHVAPR